MENNLIMLNYHSAGKWSPQPLHLERLIRVSFPDVLALRVPSALRGPLRTPVGRGRGVRSGQGCSQGPDVWREGSGEARVDFPAAQLVT